MSFSDDLLNNVTKEILRSAVGRKIFCGCGVVLDVRHAVLTTGPSGGGIDCETCFDKSIQHAADQLGKSTEETLDYFRGRGIEFDDGRVLFAQTKRSK